MSGTCMQLADLLPVPLHAAEGDVGEPLVK
jgi:hypothetical protein